MELAKDKVTIFSLTTCPYCKAVRKNLKEKGVPYDYIKVDDLSDEDYTAAMEIIVKVNPRKSFPTLIFGDTGKVVIGLEKHDLDEALEAMHKKGLI